MRRSPGGHLTTRPPRTPVRQSFHFAQKPPLPFKANLVRTGRKTGTGMSQDIEWDSRRSSRYTDTSAPPSNASVLNFLKSRTRRRSHKKPESVVKGIDPKCQGRGGLQRDRG